MTEQVKRYDSMHIDPASGKMASVSFVLASEHDAAVAALHQQVDGLLAENEKWQRSHRDIHEPALREAHAYIQELRAELEAARGLLESAVVLFACHCTDATAKNWHDAAGAFLTATPAPEVREFAKPSLLKYCDVRYGNSARSTAVNPMASLPGTIKAEHGGRQEAVAWSLRLPDGRTTLEKAYPKWAEGEGEGYAIQPLYTTPQPAPDVSALVEALEDSRAFTLEHDSGRSGVVRGRIDAALATFRKSRGGSD
ncbi:hypothetical protein ACUTAF_02020 [Pseudomonas sp. SP16.1]|uniref:hypothetical protein n=1 Tax=Pseudomonas sp. SP16.1 TaxID=3458854 RepID=UPI00404674B5